MEEGEERTEGEEESRGGKGEGGGKGDEEELEDTSVSGLF